MYALVATAAGVGVLALAQPAESKIVYTPADIKIGYGGVHEYNLDINHDGVTDFIVGNTSSCDYPGCFYNLYAVPLGRNGINATGSIHFARALHAGARIGPPRSVTNFTALMVAAFYGSQKDHFISGHWVNVRNRYLALTLNVEGEIHYGWARLSVKVSRGSMLDIAATLTGYAYETIPNKPIIAGRTKGTDDLSAQDLSPDAALTNPISKKHQPATLGALALGAPGLFVWRRKESPLESN
jgi:hypothetical protein